RRIGRSVLVSGQVAIAVVLLAIATFIYRDFAHRLENGPGFRRERPLEMWFDPSLVGSSAAEADAFYHRLAARIDGAPGVNGWTLTSFVPVDGGAAQMNVVPEAFIMPPGQDTFPTWSAAVDERYLDVFGIPLVAGRGIAATDRAGTPAVAV